MKADQMMWAITYPVGRRGERRIADGTVRSTRSRAIRAHEKANGRRWADLRKGVYGDRCVKVRVMEQ